MKDLGKSLLRSDLTRRTFVGGTAKTAMLASVASGVTLPFNVLANDEPKNGIESVEETKISACLVNCGSRCPLKVKVKDGVIDQIQPEDGINDDVLGEHEIRPCIRGRSNRYRTYNHDRIKTPLLRTGKRGEGKFKAISWDEATSIVAKQLQQTIEKYGNEAIYYNYGTGCTGANLHGRNAMKRFLSFAGGFLNYHNSYSSAQISRVEPFVYGEGKGSFITEMHNSDLVVMFGQNLAETRMSGGGQIQEIYRALERSNAKVIIIDPRYTDSSIGLNAEWIPIRPGTDAALVAGMVHTMVSEGLTNDDFINKYAVGWDESSLPKGAPKGASYKSYVMGQGSDGIEKTAKWASSITRIPEARIKQLARELISANNGWISQGWGLQRTANGEENCRAIMMLPVITGQFGKPGTNTGNWCTNASANVAGFSVANPVKTSIPCFLWEKAIREGTEMTANKDYVIGKDRLDTNVKFLWNYASNVTMNQHADLNSTEKTLSDESLCEFILTWDNHMTASARWSDLVLPDVCWLEVDDLVNNSYATGPYTYAIRMSATIKPLWENRPNYDVLAEIAKKMGFADQFTEGRSYQQWIEHVYNQTSKMNGGMPSFEETKNGAVLLRDFKSGDKYIGLRDFRHNPKSNPLKTPSGKIEIYSTQLAELNEKWEFPAGQGLKAVPEYVPSIDGHEAKRLSEYPLQLTGFHTKAHTHSTYANVLVVREAVPDELWMNPIDANARGLSHGDFSITYNEHGKVRMKVRVTNRVMPGVVAMPQGAWRKPDKNGIDIGGCINSITNSRPTPLSKGNPQHSNLVEVKRA